MTTSPRAREYANHPWPVNGPVSWARARRGSPRTGAAPGTVYPRSVHRLAGLLGVLALGELALGVAPARADDSSSAATVQPPSTGHSYVQYGVAFTVEGVASAGPICRANAPCILGSGAGIVARVGWRPVENLYIGGAYEFSKQDPNNLYRLGILQQARAELRRYVPTGSRTIPFAMVGAGLVGYGDEWFIDTWGVTAAIGVGIELELSTALHLGVAVAYRPLYLRSWVDSIQTSHDAGIAHIVGIELALEVQDRIGPSRASQTGQQTVSMAAAPPEARAGAPPHDDKLPVAAAISLQSP